MTTIEVTIDDVQDVLSRLYYFYNDTLFRMRSMALIREDFVKVREKAEGLLDELATLKSVLDNYKTLCTIPTDNLSVAAAEEYIRWKNQGIYLLSGMVSTDAEEHKVKQLKEEVYKACSTVKFSYSGVSVQRFAELRK